MIQIVDVIGYSKNPIKDSSAILLLATEDIVTGPTVLESIAEVIGQGTHPIERNSDILRAIIEHPKVNPRVLTKVIWAIGQKPEIEDAQGLLELMVTDTVTEKVLWNIVKLLRELNIMVRDSLWNSIIASEKVSDRILLAMAVMAAERKIAAQQVPEQ